MSLQNIIKEGEAIFTNRYYKLVVHNDSLRLKGFETPTEAFAELLADLSSRETVAYRAGLERAREIYERLEKHRIERHNGRDDYGELCSIVDLLSQELKVIAEGK